MTSQSLLICFADVVAAQNFINITKSWIEQREFTYLAIDALQDHPVVKDIKAEMAHLIAKQPDLTSM